MQKVNKVFLISPALVLTFFSCGLCLADNENSSDEVVDIGEVVVSATK